MKREYRKIYCCGDCVQYDMKKHRCRVGAHIEGTAGESFYRDCPETIYREENEPLPEWIPCKERLPEYRENVLTIMPDGEMEVNWIIDDDTGEWFNDGAIAWMPLPEPYKEEQEE